MTKKTTSLFNPIKLANLNLSNRVFMAPMTRSRAEEGHVPSRLAPEYYAQRAAAGLIITEASQVSDQGIGYISTPGIHTQAQVDGWRKVTDAVHAKGGHIFIQLWHVGRVSHPDFHGGKLPVAPSAIGFEGEAYTPEGRKRTVTPRALEAKEIETIIQDFAHAARLARQAGFDGVEIHGANGYLPAQFLEDGANQRQDEWGGSIENRARFLLRITEEAIKVWGAERVGVRISPNNTFNGMSDSNPKALYTYVVKRLSEMKIAYLHVLEHLQNPAERLSPLLRDLFEGVFIANGGFDQKRAEQALIEGEADAIAFGVPFISNPDLPQRFERGLSLTPADPKTFYGGGAEGYTDYPRAQ